MEKSGKPGLSARLRRLLILAAALCGASPLFAYEAELFVSSYEITAGTPVLFEFSIRDAEPGRTRLEEPEMPASFTATASRKELRDLSDDGRWGVLTTGHRTATVISREWVPSEAGTFSLGPFVMFVGEETLSLPPVTLTVNSSPVHRAAAILLPHPFRMPVLRFLSSLKAVSREPPAVLRAPLRKMPFLNPPGFRAGKGMTRSGKRLPPGTGLRSKPVPRSCPPQPSSIPRIRERLFASFPPRCRC